MSASPVNTDTTHAFNRSKAYLPLQRRLNFSRSRSRSRTTMANYGVLGRGDCATDAANYNTIASRRSAPTPFSHLAHQRRSAMRRAAWVCTRRTPVPACAPLPEAAPRSPCAHPRTGPGSPPNPAWHERWTRGRCVSSPAAVRGRRQLRACLAAQVEDCAGCGAARAAGLRITFEFAIRHCCAWAACAGGQRGGCPAIPHLSVWVGASRGVGAQPVVLWFSRCEKKHGAGRRAARGDISGTQSCEPFKALSSRSSSCAYLHAPGIRALPRVPVRGLMASFWRIRPDFVQSYVGCGEKAHDERAWFSLHWACGAVYVVMLISRCAAKKRVGG